MNKLLNTALCAAAILTTGVAGAAELTIHIDDVKSATGNLMVGIYSSAGTFLKKPDNGSGAAAATSGNKIVFKDLPAGEYAFAVYHDVNSNGKMDKNLIGIPTEDYAFSNNAMGKMGPPSFDDAKFALPAEGATVRVSLK